MVQSLKKVVLGFWSLLVGMKVTLRNFFQRPVTLQYPWEKWTLPPRYRGLLFIKDFFDEETTGKRAPFYDEAEVAPCMEACPACTDARGYITAVAERRFRDGVRILKDTYPFAGSLGRVCPAPCEKACNRFIAHDAPLTIRQLKRFLADYDRSLPPGERVPLAGSVPSPRPGRIAVIGAGPAGLACATDLAKMGYDVTVFEGQPVAGGYLYLGIPEYRLPREILKDEVDAILALGVKLRLNTRIGREMAFEDFKTQGFDAIFIGAGAVKPIRMGLEGEDQEGIIPGEDFLLAANLGRPVEIGKKVAVIGGGNTAIDCARVSKRLGRDVTILYRRTMKEMPADIHEVMDALEEGVKLEILVSPNKILGKEGKVVGVECVRNRLGELDASFRRRPVPIPASEFVYECDTVLSAISRGPDLEFLPSDIKLTKHGTIEVDEDMATSRKGVFAGGDVTLGAATVIQAIACGKKAALGIHKYLEEKGKEK